MSSITAPSSAMGRPSSITGAICLIALIVALTVPTVIVSMDGFDAAFVAIAATLATLKVVGAGGLWRCRKWGMYIAFVVVALDTLLSLGSFLDDAAGAAEITPMTVTFILGVVTLVLLVLPGSRRAYV